MFDFSNARHHMVESQIRTNDVTNLDVLRAFRQTRREKFTPKAQKALSYSDVAIDVGEGRWMSRPRDFAKLVDAADIQSTDIVLDIGCGRGYSTAVLSQIAETVVGIEDTDERVDRATQILADEDVTNAAVVRGDLKSGAAEHGPFDVIFVNGAVSDVPQSWLNQLADGGRLAVIVQSGPGDTTGMRIVFDASAKTLTGFERKTTFEL